ncbi:DDE 3 domain-containing protein, partial [Aphis craccivora]
MYLIVCFYHSQMNSEIFQNWFENMLQLLEEPCIIVIDKYSHGRKYSKVKHKKYDVKKWLKDKGVNLRWKTRIKITKPREKEGRHPPYYCQYYLIEFIWAQVKVGVVASKDITFKIVDLEKLMNEALNTVITVTQNNRKRCVRHSEKLYLLDNCSIEKQFINHPREIRNCHMALCGQYWSPARFRDAKKCEVEKF